MRSTEVAVLGAGPAGLAAAWRAAEAGHEVVVVEASSSVGGMAGSFEVAGIRVDHGSHRLHPSVEPAILAALKRLLGDDLQVRERRGRIRLGGRWIAFPLRTGDLLRHLPPRLAAGAARDALTGPLRRPRADTFAEVVRTRLGPTLLREFYGPYVRKLWDTDPSELAGELARRRVGAGSVGDVVRRALRGRRPENRHFFYPRRGFGQICERLAEAATEAGVRLLTSTPVTGLSLRPQGAVVEVAGAPPIEAARVWSTLPLPVLATVTVPAPPEPALEAAVRLRHRAVVLAYLVLDRPRYTAFDAHYFPEPDVATSRLSEPKNYRTDPEDPPDRTVLCAEIPCWEGDERWRAGPDVLVELVLDDLARVGLEAPEPVGFEVRRLPRVYPVYRPGFEADLAALEQWAASWPSLLTFGRQGLFVPDNTHHALAMGWAAAAALRSDGSFNTARWCSARDGFRSHVVED